MQTISPIGMIVVFSLFLCVGQTLFSSSLLLKSFFRERNVANLYLFFFMVTTCSILSLYYLFDFWLRELPHFILSYTPLLPAVPVSLYLYTRAITSSNRFRHTWALGAHFLPCLIVFMAMLPFYFLPGIEKIEWLFFRNSNYITMSDTQVFTSRVIPLLIIAIVGHGLCYTYLIVRLIRKHESSISNRFSYMEGVNLAWLKYISFTIFALYIAYPLLKYFPIFNRNPNLFWIASVVTGCSFISIFAFFGVTQRPILSIARNEYLNIDVAPSENIEQSEPIIGRDSQPHDDQLLDQIASHIVNLMEQKKLYLNPKLNIGELSEAAGLPTKDISKAINSCLKKNFMEFINDYRIQDAKVLLADDPDVNVLQLAFEVGFNSKTAFYEAFRRVTGSTPSQYRRSISKPTQPA
ncbi:AraC family transcriptional regulator [Gilvimarinus algae]|uniref:Helix-turn-helix domain-containing protein n=1 Tax=Gilvimarinus algae TaxID=3058037 RepID=A0ABT8TBZ9_9GAMM|nr:helix-turn-helix domain-containing protein [Gilvimarinus sp. SDUM040014]MDO3380903.1 helix-turn-helix domain-containing protein [Gilvimarinus sp. SDUM040014]